MKPIKYSGLERLYQISETGDVYSNIKKRYLKGAFNSVGYRMVYLTFDNGLRCRWFSVARLVAFTYLPEPPPKTQYSPKLEIHHIDHNKTNNHYSNLAWVTHSENILKSFTENYRKHVNPWNYRFEAHHSEETRRLMSEAHKKSVHAFGNGIDKDYNSIEELLQDLKMYRRAFNRHIKTGKPYKGYIFSVLEENNEPPLQQEYEQALKARDLQTIYK